MCMAWTTNKLKKQPRDKLLKRILIGQNFIKYAIIYVTISFNIHV